MNSYWITLLFGVLGFFLALIKPNQALKILLVVLYFPVFPAVSLGSIEFSASSLLVLGLTLAALFQPRKQKHPLLASWQWLVLFALMFAFILATSLSVNLSVSSRFFPNLAIYLMILFSTMVLVDTPQKLWSLANLIIVLDFILSIWRTELGPLRGFLGLPSFGINGAVFLFHPGVALLMAFQFFPPLRKMISKTRRLFFYIALLSLIAHSIILQTRSAWLAWTILIFIILWQVRMRKKVAIFSFVFIVFLLAGYVFRDVISQNLAMTQDSLTAFYSGDALVGNSGDLIRIRAQQIGWRMFLERPLFGWGPNQFNELKPLYAMDSSKESIRFGAFNAWLLYLTEMGAVTVAIVLAIFLLPLAITIYWLRFRNDDAMTVLAFGFALGSLAIGIHLLFIDLFYSFAWTQFGLSLAAARLVQSHAILSMAKNE